MPDLKRVLLYFYVMDQNDKDSHNLGQAVQSFFTTKNPMMSQAAQWLESFGYTDFKLQVDSGENATCLYPINDPDHVVLITSRMRGFPHRPHHDLILQPEHQIELQGGVFVEIMRYGEVDRSIDYVAMRERFFHDRYLPIDIKPENIRSIKNPSTGEREALVTDAHTVMVQENIPKLMKFGWGLNTLGKILGKKGPETNQMIDRIANGVEQALQNSSVGQLLSNALRRGKEFKRGVKRSDVYNKTFPTDA